MSKKIEVKKTLKTAEYYKEIPISYKLFIKLKANIIVAPEKIFIKIEKKTFLISALFFSLLTALFLLPTLQLDRFFAQYDWNIKGLLLASSASIMFVFCIIIKDFLSISRKDLQAKITDNKLSLVNIKSTKDPWILPLEDFSKAKEALEAELKESEKDKSSPVSKFFNVTPYIFLLCAVIAAGLSFINPHLFYLQIIIAYLCLITAISLFRRNSLLKKIWNA